MDAVVVFARAKINPALDVLGRGPGGYHNLRTVMQTLRLHDTLRLRKLNEPTLVLRCGGARLPADERNLVYQAVRFIQDTYPAAAGVAADLRKRIPVAAGLAGGSSDCAAALHGMNRLFDLRIPPGELMEIGRRFGADVPFCLLGGSALTEGAGEVLTPLPPHPAAWVVVACPRIPVSTRDVFTAYDETYGGGEAPLHPDVLGMTAAVAAGDLPRIAACFGNALAPVTEARFPVVRTLTALMRQCGALNASMSGSGPSVFGYFTGRNTATAAVRRIRRACSQPVDVCLTQIDNRSVPRT